MRRALWFFLVLVGSSYFIICFIAAGIDWWASIGNGIYRQSSVYFLIDTLVLVLYTYVLYYFVQYKRKRAK